MNFDYAKLRVQGGRPIIEHQAIAKVFTSEVVHEITLSAAECFGAMGVMRDMPLQKYVHDALFGLYASVKPVKSYANLPSLQQNVDIVFLRETTEGMMRSGTVVAGSGEFRPNDEISIGMRVITRRGSNRVARAAFEIARMRSRKQVTAVHKAPTYKLCCGMFAEECRKVAADFPDVRLEEVLIDSFAMM